MNSHVFLRALGITSPEAFQRAETTRLLHALHIAPEIRFDGSNSNSGHSVQTHNQQNGTKSQRKGGGATPPSEVTTDSMSERVWAHMAGVNCLTIDRFEGR